MQTQFIELSARHRPTTRNAARIGDLSWIVLAAVGWLIWCGTALCVQPCVNEVAWARLLLWLPPLVLVPLGLGLWEQSTSTTCDRVRRHWLRVVKRLQLPAALLLGASQLVEQGWLAAGIAASWLVCTALVAMIGLAALRDLSSRAIERHALAQLSLNMALVYLAIGGAWAVVDRSGWRPLGFPPVIVMLTAIHFHYAGFALPLVAGLTAKRIGNRTASAAAVAAVAGMPLVAVGITATHLGWWPILETLAGLWMSAAAVLIAAMLARAARWRGLTSLVALLWMIAAGALVVGMGLAAMYALRHVAPLEWLDIARMRATHGTLNAIGFALPALVGWALEFRLRPRKSHAEGSKSARDKRLSASVADPERRSLP